MGLTIVGGNTADRMQLDLDQDDPVQLDEAADLTGAEEADEASAARPSEETVGTARRALGADTERLLGHLNLVVPEDDDDPERRLELAAALYVPGEDAGLVAARTLAGQSALGELNTADRKMFVEEMVDGWRTDDHGSHFDRQMSSLRAGLSFYPGSATDIAEPLADAAIDTLRGPQDRITTMQAASLGTTAVEAAKTPEARRELLERLGPDAAGLASSLQLGDSWPHGSGADRVERVVAAGDLLEAAALGEPTEASRETTQAIFEQLPAEAYAFTDLVPGQMAGALAAHWYPDDPEARAAETERFTGILDTPQGQDLLGASDTIPPQTRARVLGIIRSDPSIDAESLAAQSDGWAHPVIAERLAAPRAQTYLDSRGDEPAPLWGAALSNTVGQAMSLPPTLPAGETEQERAAREANLGLGSHDYYATGEYADSVAAVRRSIQEVGGPHAAVTVLPIQHSSGAAGPIELPLFRVQDAETGEDRFVDNTGRQYQNFEDWRDNNRLPAGNVVYPVDGHLSADENGQVALQSENSHATIDTNGERALAVADGAVMVGGVVAGGLVIAGSGGTAAPFVFAGASAYGTVRSGQRLADRAAHGESLDPIHDAGARSAWLELGANSLGLAGASVSIGAAALSRSGNAFAPLTNRVAGHANLVATGADGAAIADGAHQMATHWDEMSGGQRAQLGLSMAFWGTSIPARQRIRPDIPTPARPLRPRANWTDADFHAAYMSHAPEHVRRELADVTPEQLRAVFPEGGAFPMSLDAAAQHPGFGARVREDPEMARAFVNANQAWDGRMPLHDATLEAWNSAGMQQVPHPRDSAFVLRERGAMAPNSRPEVEVSASLRRDHNGAFHESARLGPAEASRRARTTGGTDVRARHLVVDGQPRQDMNGVAVFSAHGNGMGFTGASNRHASLMMADAIGARAAAGRPIDTVVLDSCGQRNMGLDFRANAQRFEQRLNRELAARGLSPVQVLAARDPGPVAGTSQTNWLTRERYTTQWTPEADGGRVDVGGVALLGGTALAGAAISGGGFWALSEITSEERGRLRRSVDAPSPVPEVIYTPVSGD